MTSSPDLYPPSIAGVPSDLTSPSRSYRRSVGIVLASLFIFVLFYLALVAGSGYLLYLAITYPLGEGGRGPVFLKIGAIGMAAMLFAFLVKGLFKRQGNDDTLNMEVREEDHPELFQFIRRICEETGAPFPYRVFLSPDVNAAVFYNSSLLNLLFPVKKNLLIGLGLVNSLPLHEFKAVLAHEFGHFSQSSMRLGRYVYTANHVIADMIYGRDKWDDLLARWRSLDIRISLWGWILYGFIWVLRKILEGCFRAINFVNFALSREMEFHADLVAVSLTGSDALIHALRRLDFANDCFMQAFSDVKDAADHRLYTRDLFHHQTHAAAHLRKVRNEPTAGLPPALPADPNEKAQVFQPGDDGIPSMWASHPPNYDREQNAKRVYFRGVEDNRSPWLLFRNPEAVREAMTQRLYQESFGLPADTKYTIPEMVQAFIDDEHEETTYDARYYGLYDGRYVEPGDLEALVQAVRREPWTIQRLNMAYVKLYGGEMKAWMEKHTERRGEYQLLHGLSVGDLKLRARTFVFREHQYPGSDVKRLLEMVDKELEKDLDWLKLFDAQVFQAHYQMALHLCNGAHAELRRRYEFHLGVQQILRNVAEKQGEAENMLNWLSSRDQVSEADIQETVKYLRQAREALDQALASAEFLRLPPLRNLKEGEPLGPFLLDEPLVEDMDPESKSITGEWVGRLMRQMSSVQSKARRIHFKSLGGILPLQEKIGAEWRAAVAARPPAAVPQPGAPAAASQPARV